MDTITFGSFVRSGNHYFLHMVETGLISVKCEWLSHRISDWDNKTNRVTTIRHPLECVTSWISTTADERPDRANKVLEWYVAYYNKVQELGSQIITIPFNRLINDSLGSINQVCDHYGLKRSFFSNNDTFSAAFTTDFDFIWANPDKNDYNQIESDIKESSFYPLATKLFEELN